MHVFDQHVVVVVGIHDPSQRQLAGVAQAHDALGFGLGPAQGGQQQTGQNGNDGNDAEQLDEGKTPRCRPGEPRGSGSHDVARLRVGWASLRLHGDGHFAAIGAEVVAAIGGAPFDGQRHGRQNSPRLQHGQTQNIPPRGK